MAISKKLRQQVYDKYNGLCAYTGFSLDHDWQVDHIQSKCLNEWDNKKIKIWEDNNFATEPYLMTYRECHENSDYPVTIATSVIDW